MKEMYILLVSIKKNGIYGPIENGKKYPSSSLSGAGIRETSPGICLLPE
jgi:hypothetical protein